MYDYSLKLYGVQLQKYLTFTHESVCLCICWETPLGKSFVLPLYNNVAGETLQTPNTNFNYTRNRKRILFI